MIGIIVGMSNRVVTKTNEKSFVFCSYEVHILLRGDRHPFLLFIMKEILAKNIFVFTIKGTYMWTQNLSSNEEVWSSITCFPDQSGREENYEVILWGKSLQHTVECYNFSRGCPQLPLFSSSSTSNPSASSIIFTLKQTFRNYPMASHSHFLSELKHSLT